MAEIYYSVSCRSRILVPLFFAIGARAPFAASLVKRTGKRRTKNLNKKCESKARNRVRTVEWCAEKGRRVEPDTRLCGWRRRRSLVVSGDLCAPPEMKTSSARQKLWWPRGVCRFESVEAVRQTDTVMKKANASWVWCRLGLRTLVVCRAGESREANTKSWRYYVEGRDKKNVLVLNNYTHTDRKK